MGEQIFDSTFFEHTMNNPTMTSTPLPPPTTEALPQTIKLEQLENHDTPSPSHDSYSRSSEPSQTPAPEGSSSSNGSKPVKKRKSWGQVLPEPKTSLPPRKRAKTEDEKEQRRIERVKRNRLAAHNSRERKRHEYEILQTEKDELEANMQAYKQRMAQMEAELNYFRSKYPGETPQPVFDLATSPKDSFETICPAQTSAPFPGPISPISMDSPESPRDSSCSPETPPPVFEASPNFDSTQYSAAVLCDLQCQSISGTSLQGIWAYLTLLHLTLQSMKSQSIWKTFSTLTSAAQQQVLAWNPLLVWLILPSMFLDHPSSNTATPLLTALLTALTQSSTTCRVPLAQLRLATRPSQRGFSIEDDSRLSEKRKQAGSAGGILKQRMMTFSRLRQLGRRKGAGSHRVGRAWARENMGCGFTRRRMES
jgi:transcriptional activator HAC1